MKISLKLLKTVKTMQLNINSLYKKMLDNMGPSHWWPADSKTEIIVGAITIQNTNWRNADKSVKLFRQETGFDPGKILALSEEDLQELVRPAGFYKNKTRSITAVLTWLNQFNNDYSAIAKHYGAGLRKQLLSLRGVGPETADVILTYIFDQATFIADKYARTLFTHLGVKGLSDYQSLKARVQLPSNFTAAMAQDFHGQIDEFGKVYFHPESKFKESFLANDRLHL